MRNLPFIIIFSGLVLSGCAFKESASDRQQQESRKMDGRILGATLTWDGQEKPIALAADGFVRTAGMWTRDQVVSLPVDVPETTLLTVQVARDPQDVKEWTAQAVVTTGDDLNERALGTQIIETTPAEMGTRLKVRLIGANTLFRPDHEQRMYLTLKLRARNDADSGAVRLVISTPPSRLTVLRDELVFGRDPKGLSPSLRVLFSQAETRTMVRQIRLRNDSFETIRLTLPFKSHGMARLRGTKFSAEEIPHFYFSTYAQKSEDQVWDVESDFYVFPLSDDLPATWTGFSQAMLGSLILTPGSTIDLGIYMTDSMMGQLQTHPTSIPSVSALASSGIAHCSPYPRIWIPGDPGWYDLFDGTHAGSPWHFPTDTIALMKQAGAVMRTCVDSGWNVDSCNQAAMLDEELDHRKIPHPDNGHPWMVFYGCPSIILCPNDPAHACATHHGWSWAPVTGNFQIGIQTNPVTVEWKSGQIPIFTRFLPTGDSGEGEARTLTFSPSGTLIRD